MLSLLTVPGPFLAAEPRTESSAAFAPGDAAVGVHYDAPPGCPALDAYLAHVEARLGPDWKAVVGRFAERVEVTISRIGESYRGSIEFVNAQGERFSRNVSGEVCAEVVDGIGLMTELAVKSKISEQPSGSVNRGEAGETSTPAPPFVKSTPVRPAVTGSVERSQPPRQPAPAPDSKFHVRVGGRASLTTGVGPEIALGPGAFAGLELAKAQVGIGFDAFDSGEVPANTFRAEFRLLSWRLEGCPRSFELTRWATVEPCALAELGSFRAAPRLDPPRVTVSEPKSALWGALGALGRLVLLRPPFLVELEVVGRAPLRRERFFVETQDRVVFRIPSGSAGAAVGLGLRF